MTTDVRPVDAGLSVLSDLNVTNEDVVSAVRQMYARHPFPPPQRKNSYRRHAAYVHQFLRECGIVADGATFGDIACGTGLSRLSFEDQCDVIDLIARPYWISLFAQKAS